MNICYVYILSSRDHRDFSIRATTDLKHGIRYHRRRVNRRAGRRKVYQKLVHVEEFPGLTAAVEREREIREWPRAQLMHFVSRNNPGWAAISIRAYLASRARSADLRFLLRRAPS
ncbi:MAG TPA: hypothetical protein VJ998_00490 [Pseudomonadales bacterium]|nr:hypothetical protein [Pseudomonadales bacterium]